MVEETKKKARLISPLLLLFIGTMILANIAGRMSGTMQPLYLQDLGASVKQVGLFFTIGMIAPLFFQIFGGWLSDSIGRLEAIAIGSIGGVLGFMVFIMAPTWQWLLLAAVLSALAPAFVAPSFQSFIAEQSTEETRGRVYGIMTTMFMIVNVIGPVLGGAIAQGMSFRIMFIVAAILYSTAAVIRIGMGLASSKKKAASGEQREKPSFGKLKQSLGTIFGMLTAGGLITWIFISDGIRDISFNLSSNLTPIYLENIMNLSILQIGSLESVTAIAAMILMVPAGWFSDKFGERISIVGGFGGIAIGWAIFLFGTTFWQFAISRAVVGMGWAFIDPAYSSLISKAVPEKLRGTAFGLFSTSLGFISLPAPWIGAQLWEAVNPRFPFFIPLLALLVTMPIIWIKFRLPNQSTMQAEHEIPADAALAAGK